jgi:hypothetical protein
MSRRIQLTYKPYIIAVQMPNFSTNKCLHFLSELYRSNDIDGPLVKSFLNPPARPLLLQRQQVPILLQCFEHRPHIVRSVVDVERNPQPIFTIRNDDALRSKLCYQRL